MNLQDCFKNENPTKKFIPYMSLGDPNYDLSIEWGKSLIDGGANILELGIPFSDPTADGPVIQESYKRALMNNPFSMNKIFETTNQIHQYNNQIPLVYLTYFNLVFSYGLEQFFKNAYTSGIRGIVIPDIPYDTKDSNTILEIANSHQVNLIHLVTPATIKSRIKEISKYSSGFIYYVTSFGVTGERSQFSSNLKDRIELVKEISGLPVCAGFGISKPEQAKTISQFADGIIIGSAIQKIIIENGNDIGKCKFLLQEYSTSISGVLK